MNTISVRRFMYAGTLVVAGVLPLTAQEITIGNGTIKLGDGTITLGDGVIAVSPDAIVVPGVTVNNGAVEVAGGGQSYSGADFAGANLSGRDFSNSTFVGVDFAESNLSGADFSGSRFQGVDFANSNLTDVNFSGSNIQGVDFASANLTQANFSGAQVQGVDYSASNLNSACFAGASLIGNEFTGASVNGTIFAGSTRAGNVFGGVNLQAAVMDGAAGCATKKSEAGRPEVTKSATIAQALAAGPDARVDLTVNFEFDSDSIQAQGHAQVLEIANALNSLELAAQSVLIEGHTDSLGNDGYNLDLSYRRAISVMRALTEDYGVDQARVQVRGFGESRPIADNQTDEGRAINRRVTLVNLGAG